MELPAGLGLLFEDGNNNNTYVDYGEFGKLITEKLCVFLCMYIFKYSFNTVFLFRMYWQFCKKT